MPQLTRPLDNMSVTAFQSPAQSFSNIHAKCASISPHGPTFHGLPHMQHAVPLRNPRYISTFAMRTGEEMYNVRP